MGPLASGFSAAASTLPRPAMARPAVADGVDSRNDATELHVPGRCSGIQEAQVAFGFVRAMSSAVIAAIRVVYESSRDPWSWALSAWRSVSVTSSVVESLRATAMTAIYTSTPRHAPSPSLVVHHSAQCQHR